MHEGTVQAFVKKRKKEKTVLPFALRFEWDVFFGRTGEL